jgi:hypothetical protein
MISIGIRGRQRLQSSLALGQSNHSDGGVDIAVPRRNRQVWILFADDYVAMNVIAVVLEAKAWITPGSLRPYAAYCSQRRHRQRLPESDAFCRKCCGNSIKGLISSSRFIEDHCPQLVSLSIKPSHYALIRSRKIFVQNLVTAIVKVARICQNVQEV